MKINLLKISCTLIVAVSFFVVSCSKEGAAGPVGPAGPAGPAGPTGATGAANVKYSAWLNATFKPIAPDSSVWRATITALQLDDSVLNKGEIKVYWNIGSDSTHDQFVVSLPTLDIFISDVAVSVNPYFSYQSIDLISNLDVSSYTQTGHNYSQFRYVVIPGGTNIGGRYSTVDWKDYKAVKAYLGIKD